MGAKQIGVPEASDVPRERRASESNCWILNVRDLVGLISAAR